MRVSVEIDDERMAAAQEACGRATKKATVEQALQLLVKLRRQEAVVTAFGRYRWRGDLSRSRTGRGIS